MSTRRLVDTDVLGRQDVWSTRRLVDRTFGRQDVWSTGRLVDRTFGRQDVWVTGRLVERMFRRQPFGGQRFRRMDVWTKIVDSYIIILPFE